MRARVISAAGALIALACCLPAPAGAAGGPYAWHGEPSGVFRSATLDRGEWIWTNGVNQSFGANTDGLHREDYFKAIGVPGDPTGDTRDLSVVLTYNFFGLGRDARNGDYALPDDPARFPDGTGELAELRLAVSGGDLHVRFLWNAMPRPDAQIATLAFATDGAGAAGRAWPHGARLRSPWQAALTAWGTGAALTGPDGHEHAVAITTGDHVSEVSVPLSDLPPGPWRLTGGSGLSDPAAPSSYWSVPAGPASASRPGSGGPASPTNVWDLLFATDATWSFDERRQADLLANGSAAGASATVDPTVLARRASEPAAPATGTFSRMFSSAISEGDGITKVPGLNGADAPGGVSPPGLHDGAFQTWSFHGRLQDYGMRVPARYASSDRRRWPLIVYLHGFGGSPDEAFYLPIGLVDRADSEGYVVAAPRGRGDGFYTGSAMLDVLEVIADVERHYRIDPDRVYLMGHSMGGYGTNTLATHHPDLFAAVAPAEGTADADLSANLRNVPWFEITADEDLDAGGQEATALYDRLSADGYDATLLRYHLKIHEYSSIYDTLDRLFAFFGAHRRVRDPAVVTWVRRPDDDDPKLGLVHDGAYWLDAVTAADAAKPATVTVTSDAIPHATPDPKAAKRSTADVDTGGPSGRTTGVLSSTVPGAGPAVPRANALHVRCANTASLTVDVRRARLALGSAPLTIDADCDHALTIVLRSHRRERRIAVPAGAHVLRLHAAR